MLSISKGSRRFFLEKYAMTCLLKKIGRSPSPEFSLLLELYTKHCPVTNLTMPGTPVAFSAAILAVQEAYCGIFRPY